MKVLFIITSGDIGGAQRYVLELAKEFHGEIATGAEKNDLAYWAEDNNIKVYRLYQLVRSINPLNDIPALFDLVRLVKKTKPDIIHLNSSKAGFLGSLIKIFVPQVKIVYTAHGFVFNEPKKIFVKWFYIFLEKVASFFRDYIIAVSDADKQSAALYNIIDQNKISVIYNGLGPIKFLNKSSARQYLGLSLDKFTIGALSNLYPAKGIDTFIDAAALMPKSMLQNISFAVIGDGPLENSLKTKIVKYGLENSFKLLGHRELASHYLKAFDIFVMPSKKEGFPFALLEAMQAGLPIIATSVGGNQEALSEAGLTVPPERPDLLAEKLVNLIKNQQQRQILSEDALARSAQFTLEHMIEKTQAVYEHILGN